MTDILPSATLTWLRCNPAFLLWWTGLAPQEIESAFSGSLISTSFGALFRPHFGPSFDLIWGPLCVQEVLPMTDILPSATLTWLRCNPAFFSGLEQRKTVSYGA